MDPHPHPTSRPASYLGASSGTVRAVETQPVPETRPRVAAHLLVSAHPLVSVHRTRTQRSRGAGAVVPVGLPLPPPPPAPLKPLWSGWRTPAALRTPEDPRTRPQRLVRRGGSAPSGSHSVLIWEIGKVSGSSG